MTAKWVNTNWAEEGRPINEEATVASCYITWLLRWSDTVGPWTIGAFDSMHFTCICGRTFYVAAEQRNFHTLTPKQLVEIAHGAPYEW
jgi:hypothetical protein